MNLQEYIKYVKESCLNEGIVPTPDMILDVSCRLLISNNISQNKKENIQAIKNSQPCLQAKRADAKSNQGKQNSEKNSTSFSNNGKVTYNSPSTSPEEYLSNKQIYFF